VIALALGLAAAPALLQDPAPLLRRLRAERQAAFLASWEAADEPRRSAALELLADLREEREPAGLRPSLTALAAAGRALDGADPASAVGDELQRFADLVDLRPVPGAFASASSGRGTPLEVRVSRLPIAPLEPMWDEVRVRLLWIAPDGGERVARTEPIAGAAFAGAGFPMYVRSPLAAPSLWHLVPELELDGRAVRGQPVPVASIDELDTRWARLRARTTALAGVDVDLVGWIERGERPAVGGDPRPWLAWVERLADPDAAADDHAPPGRAWLPAAADDPAAGLLAIEGLDPVGLGPPGPASGRPLWVLLAPPEEPSAFAFREPLGSRWRAVAERAGADVVAFDTDRPDADALARAIRGLAEPGATGPTRPVILIARGRAVALLPLVCARAEGAVSGVVACAAIHGPPESLASLDVLWIGPPGEETRASEGAAFVEWAESAGEPLVDELALPERTEGWLVRRSALGR